MVKRKRDRSLEKARTTFRNTPEAAYRNPNPQEGVPAYIQQMALDPNAALMMQQLSKVDTAWIADFVLARPEWDGPTAYFHTALVDLSRSLIMDFLHYVTMNKQFPLERLIFLRDLLPGAAVIHERLELIEAAPANPDNNSLSARIPFEKSPEGAVQVDADGNPQRIAPDALILLQTQNGKVDANGICHFTCSATLVTYGILAAARIRVNFTEGIRVDKSVILRPAKDIAEWEAVIPSRVCVPAKEETEEVPSKEVPSKEASSKEASSKETTSAS